MTTPPMGGGAPDPVDPSGLINPDQFVCSWTTLDTSSIEAGASSLRTMGTKVHNEVQGMRSTWNTLPASYEGPEQALVYSLLDDPVNAAGDLKERLDSAAAHVETYAGDLFEIALELMGLESEAREFRAEAQAGYVEEKQYAVGGNSPNRTNTEEVAWGEHGPAVEQNNTLLARYAGLMERISSAAVYCANSINELQMGTVESGFTPVTAEAIMNSSQPMPWGSPVTEDRNCGESVWDGTGAFAKSTAQGVSSMAGFDFDDSTTWGQTMKQSWLGAANFGLSSTVALTPISYLAYAPGISSTGAGQFLQERHRVARDGAGSILGWDGASAAAGGNGWHAWKEDPVAAGTEMVLNIGTFFIPVVNGGKALSIVGRAGKAARAGKHVKGKDTDFTIPGGENITKGAPEVYAESMETSRGRTAVISDVELDTSPVPVKSGDGTAPDHDGADRDAPGVRGDGAQPVESPRASGERSVAGGGGRGSDDGNGAPAAGDGGEGRSRTLSVSEAEAQGIPKWTLADVDSARADARFVDGHPVDPRTDAPLNEAGGRRNWEMRWDPVAKEWVARNRGHGWGEMGRPVDDPNPVLFDESAGARYDSGDPHRPGEPHPHTPPEAYVPGSTEPGVQYLARSGDVDTPWRRYQEQISGWEPTADNRVPEYRMPDPNNLSKGVDFDGHVLRGDPPQEVFLEAKHGYGILDTAPHARQAQRMEGNVAKQFARQLSVLPEGAKLEWHVSDPRGATAIRNIVEKIAMKKGLDLSNVSIHTTEFP